jgi:predicted phosphodiesterase
VAARFLLVSDIHGGNQYPLMKTIVEQEQIDAVIDAGDLVNFGSTTEADAATIFRGIESLGVPYLFVKGNHDARSESDRELLDRLARVPNVVLLQPSPQSYTVQSIGGVRIAGFNDPRWFGDDNRNNAAEQQPATDAFNAAMAQAPIPDVVVSHEAAALRRVERAGIRVNGHMHAAQLEGNRIGVGTFTGGGPFSHFLTSDEGEELTGQPSAFDVATFGEDCRIASLTRYQFRNVIEGRPAYDNVTLINGSRIEEAVPAAGPEDAPRTCGQDLDPTTERIPAAPR